MYLETEHFKLIVSGKFLLAAATVIMALAKAFS